jgi:hypothetical protein
VGRLTSHEEDVAMRADGFPDVAMTDQDRAYRGSLFAEVRKALFANPYQRVWGAAGEPPLPR